MRIQCDCGTLQAELTAFPHNSPGRLMCYCADCQAYLNRLGRAELLDDWGGSEVIPVYPSEFRIISGADKLCCNRLSARGLNRWSASCCNAPIVNTPAGFPWAGILRSAYDASDPAALDRMGKVRSRIMGKDAKPDAPFRISDKIGFADMLVVLPFIVKGKLLGKHKPSPFFAEDGKTPVVEPVLLEEPAA